MGEKSEEHKKEGQAIEVTDIASYLSRINESIKSRRNLDDTIVVYRGEPECFPTPGMPGIYRGNHLEKNKYFEKNLLDEMKANRITEGKTYLECAVDSQHDEFPTRLLDVSYNALVALYFATTPYYKRYKEDEFDDKKDAFVIIYYLPKIYCAGAANIDKLFKDTIERKHKYLSHPLIQENYKLIDHIKMNRRICVQQGAFIMFQGDGYTAIAQRDYDVINIPKGSRKKLREELDRFFGINTGFIYPEPYNLCTNMDKKARKVENSEITLDTEINSFLTRVECDIRSKREELAKELFEKKADSEAEKEIIVGHVLKLEEELMKYHLELVGFFKDCEDELRKIYTDDDDYKKIKCDYYVHFNKLIDKYDTWFGVFDKKHEISRSIDEIKIEMGE